MSSNCEEQQMIFCNQQQQASDMIFPQALRFPGMNGRTIQSLNWQPQELLPCDSSVITGDSFHLLHHDNLLSKKRKADNSQDTLLCPQAVQGAKRIKDSEEKKNKVGSGDPSKDMNNNSSSEQGSAGSSSKTVKGDTTNNFKDITNKSDYIHVRARRGQATDSHSLAERVRREKISERMKYLQDLVPGCSKISGKAGMLDEIINYVQSLQKQVEFLSMKLATVNPRLDLNVHNFLGKDIQMFASSYNNHPSETISPELSYLQFLQLQQWCDMPSRPADEILQGNDLFGCSETELQSLYNNLAFSAQPLPSSPVQGADHVGVGLTNNLKMEI